VLYPTEKRVDASKEQAGRHLIKWEGDEGPDDLRKTVLRQLELKSGRLNGSAVRSVPRYFAPIVSKKPRLTVALHARSS
jgi:hypothetical protein